MIGTPGDIVFLEKLLVMCGGIIVFCLLGMATIGICVLIERAITSLFKKKD